MIAAHYGAEARNAYWNGCSTGGRQGLKEVQRFPDDYDGVIAGAPAANVVGQVSLSILVQTVLTDPGSPLPAAKLTLLKEAAIAACDANDGVTDRVIVEPAQCAFDPATTQCATADSSMCLTPGEVDAARRIYAGVVNSRTGEPVYPGASVAGEPGTAQFASNFSIGTASQCSGPRIRRGTRSVSTTTPTSRKYDSRTAAARLRWTPTSRSSLHGAGSSCCITARLTG
jgi:feruloyl esterase